MTEAKTDLMPKILVVDDESTWLYSFVDILEEEGFRVTGALSAKIASEALMKTTEPGQEAFSLIIIDVRLDQSEPYNVQGFQILQEARKLSNSPRVILVTMWPEGIKRALRSKQLKPDKFLTKADIAKDISILVEAVNDLINSKLGPPMEANL